MNTIPIDWQQLILNLRRHIETKDIAKQAGVSIACIQGMAGGKVSNPFFSTGIHLLDLHRDYCPEQHKRLLK